MTDRYKTARNFYTKKEVRERRLEKKKSYKFYTRNQELRKLHPNVRQIRNGETVSIWEE